MTYLDLVEKFPLKKINTEEENNIALEVLEGLMVDDIDQDAIDYCHVLALLIEEFEEAHYPIGDSND